MVSRPLDLGLELYATALLGAKSSPLYPMVKEAVVFFNALAFFGPELGTYEIDLASTDSINETC